ncbi:hypothetical protein As57867_025166, partial [Aphanomyces stellatus]
VNCPDVLFANGPDPVIHSRCPRSFRLLALLSAMLWLIAVWCAIATSLVSGQILVYPNPQFEGNFTSYNQDSAVDVASIGSIRIIDKDLVVVTYSEPRLRGRRIVFFADTFDVSYLAVGSISVEPWRPSLAALIDVFPHRTHTGPFDQYTIGDVVSSFHGTFGYAVSRTRDLADEYPVIVLFVDEGCTGERTNWFPYLLALPPVIRSFEIVAQSESLAAIQFYTETTDGILFRQVGRGDSVAQFRRSRFDMIQILWSNLVAILYAGPSYTGNRTVIFYPTENLTVQVGSVQVVAFNESMAMVDIFSDKDFHGTLLQLRDEDAVQDASDLSFGSLRIPPGFAIDVFPTPHFQGTVTRLTKTVSNIDRAVRVGSFQVTPFSRDVVVQLFPNEGASGVYSLNATVPDLSMLGVIRYVIVAPDVALVAYSEPNYKGMRLVVTECRNLPLTGIFWIRSFRVMAATDVVSFVREAAPDSIVVSMRQPLSDPAIQRLDIVASGQDIPSIPPSWHIHDIDILARVVVQAFRRRAYAGSAFLLNHTTQSNNPYIRSYRVRLDASELPPVNVPDPTHVVTLLTDPGAIDDDDFVQVPVGQNASSLLFLDTFFPTGISTIDVSPTVVLIAYAEPNFQGTRTIVPPGFYHRGNVGTLSKVQYEALTAMKSLRVVPADAPLLDEPPSAPGATCKSSVLSPVSTLASRVVLLARCARWIHVFSVLASIMIGLCLARRLLHTFDLTVYFTTTAAAADYSTLSWGDLDLFKFALPNFPLHHPLETGASGAIFLGTFEHQSVAIKTLLDKAPSPTQVQTFINEILFLGSLKSPFIVTLIGAAWTHPTNLQCVMEYMNLGDLRRYLADTTTESFSWWDKLACAHSIAEGLFYLHSRNMVHRDLKSRNVLLDSTKGTKLSDFGSSKQNVYDGDTMTAAVGTFRWMAPEMLLFQGYSNAVDIYSFGVVLSELNTHQVPYTDLTDFEGHEWSDEAITRQVIHEQLRPTFRSDCPIWFKALALRCMAHHPDERPSATKIMYELDSYTQQAER